jgi:hypothetical protein
VFNTEAQIEAFFMARVLDALLGLMAVALLLGIWKGRRWGEAWEGILRAYGGIALLFAFQVLLFYLAYGVSFPWGLPDLGWGFKYYLDLLTLSAFYLSLPGLLAPGGPGPSGAARAGPLRASLREPHRSPGGAPPPPRVFCHLDLDSASSFGQIDLTNVRISDIDTDWKSD